MNGALDWAAWWNGTPAPPDALAMLERVAQAGVRDRIVLRAMAAVPRALFVDAGQQDDAYADRALPIGLGQTISQPLIVGLIVQALRIGEGARVLDVGTGCGYQAAVMAACGARVISIERLAPLAEAARLRVERLGLDVEVVVGDGSTGWSAGAPYDCIAVGCAAPAPPAPLLDQLGHRGRLVVPVTRAAGDCQDLLRFTRTESGGLHRDDLGPCTFVPLVGELGYDGIDDEDSAPA